jgi:[acyl-carrier-protein] S-malonyltransferase
MTSAFVFPGQGSQEVGMLSDFAGEALVARTLEEAAEAAALPLPRIIAEGPEEELNRTDVTQPALLAASVALWRVWRARGGAMPAVMAGHSLGEYSALVCSGAIPFASAVRLVRLRGELMQRAVPAGEGAMAAVLGLDDDVVEACCAAAGGVVSPANYNAPGQVVIAGTAAAVDAAIERLKAAGAKRAIRLAVSVPSHCALMQPAQAELAAALAQTPITTPEVSVVQNVDGAIDGAPAAIRQRLVRQLAEPVRWTLCVERMSALGVNRFYECGPGKVLAGLIKRIDRDVSVASLGGASALTAALGAGGQR